MMKLVEENSGIGDLILNGVAVGQVRYDLQRFQEFMETSGLPVPGLHRIEGSIHFDAGADPKEWMDSSLRLKLDDGRELGIRLIDESGRILSEGHGPSKCLCC